jgi:hypothetical protein
MAFSYLPHKSTNPHELLAIAILRQAYVDIFNFYKSGEPAEHEGIEAIKWIKSSNGTLGTVIHAIQLVQERKGWSFGRDKEQIQRNLIKRIKVFRSLAEGKDEKKKKEIFKAWQLMST